MKKLIEATLIFTLFGLFSCNVKENEKKSIPIVPIQMSDVKEVAMSELFRRMEILSLETADTTLIDHVIDNFATVIPDKYYIFQDTHQVLTIFNADGSFVSSSKHKKGHGHGEYLIIMNYTYNQYKDEIEILTPTSIISYDEKFNHLETTKLKQHTDCLYGEIAAVSENIFALIHTGVSADRHTIYIFDRKQEKVIKEISYKNDVISDLSQNVSPLRKLDSTVYFSPRATSYYSYQLNSKDWSLEPIYQFDFGKDNINKKALKKFNDQEERDFLAFESSYPLPLRNFFNTDFLISQLRYKRQYYTFFYNVTKQTSILTSNKHLKDDKKLPLFIHFDGKILYAYVHPTALNSHIDTNLLPSDYTLENIKEDDNPVIVKYYIRASHS